MNECSGIAIAKHESVQMKLKHESVQMKLKHESVQMKLKHESVQLKLKHESVQLKLKHESVQMKLKHESVQLKLKKEVNYVDCLKEKLMNARTLNGKVSLVNDDKVMVIKSNKRGMRYSGRNVSTCYKENDFQYLIGQFDLKNEKSLMVELYNKVKYHLYGFRNNGRQHYFFIFPLDLQDMKDIDVVVPDLFKMNIKNNELMVEVLNQYITDSSFYTEIYKIKFKHRKEFNLQLLHDCVRVGNPFAPVR